MATAMEDNEPSGRPAKREQQFALFDRLPAEVRRILAVAPHDFNCFTPYKMTRPGRDLGVAARELSEIIARDMKLRATRCWGPSYPLCAWPGKMEEPA
jgi:hypothetical protein